MADTQFHIAVKRGHSRKLRFGFCPVSPKIMNADRDWPEKEELCCDTLCGQELLYPFIRRYFHGKFRWKNELNLMPFSDVTDMCREMRRVIGVLKTDPESPSIRPYTGGFAIDLLVSPEDYDEHFVDASASEKYRAIMSRIGVITEFYETVCGYLEDAVAKFEPKGYTAIAIWSPR
ncbi:MAG: hypothetical protein SOH48_07910 [Eubacteriales bacterium]|jgi:hypothetical protein